MKLDIANIATNEKMKLEGFRIFGIFPFYVRYITTRTHIRLCSLREQIQQYTEEPKISDFYDFKLQKKVIPLIHRFILIALVNGRPFGWLFTFLLCLKLKRCGHYHIWNMFLMIHKLNEPAFFLSYWKLINLKENTLLREAKQ
jgi:hypothetical protein